MTNETPSKTPLPLTFEEYIQDQFINNKPILPRVIFCLLDCRQDLETIPSIPGELLGVINILKTAEPNHNYKWHKKSQEIVTAVMEIKSNLDQSQVTTAVAYDMENLLRGFNPLKVGGAEH